MNAHCPEAVELVVRWKVAVAYHLCRAAEAPRPGDRPAALWSLIHDISATARNGVTGIVAGPTRPTTILGITDQPAALIIQVQNTMKAADATITNKSTASQSGMRFVGFSAIALALRCRHFPADGAQGSMNRFTSEQVTQRPGFCPQSAGSGHPGGAWPFQGFLALSERDTRPARGSSYHDLRVGARPRSALFSRRSCKECRDHE
jgi:hypothetical protein